MDPLGVVEVAHQDGAVQAGAEPGCFRLDLYISRDYSNNKNIGSAIVDQ
jgi:hypothetical protein